MKRKRMTQHDQDNLAFLLAQTPEGLLKWYEQASEDCKEYAMELIAAERARMSPLAVAAPSTLQ